MKRFLSLIAALFCSGCLCLCLSACVAHGSRHMVVTVAGMEFGIKDHVENDTTGQPNYTCDFTNWLQQWAQSFNKPKSAPQP